MKHFFRTLQRSVICLLAFSLLHVSPCFANKSTPQNELQEPYNRATLLPFIADGWYGNGDKLARLIKANDVQEVIEVGCWFGLSTRHIATCLPANGKVYAVDHWLGSAENQNGQAAWHPQLPMLYEYFLSNVIHEGLTDKIIPVRMASLTAAASLSATADLIYIDASHDTASVYADCVAWYPHLREGGVFCGDDWLWLSVREAVQTFAAQKGLRIEATENFWYLTQ